MDNKRINYLDGYRHEIDFALVDGVSLVLRKIRQRVSKFKLSPAEQLGLDVDDEAVITTVMALDDIDDGLVKDDEMRPLQDWWWHLGKIRAKTYPVDLLSAHLQAVYREVE